MALEMPVTTLSTRGSEAGPPSRGGVRGPRRLRDPHPLETHGHRSAARAGLQDPTRALRGPRCGRDRSAEEGGGQVRRAAFLALLFVAACYPTHPEPTRLPSIEGRIRDAGSLWDRYSPADKEKIKKGIVRPGLDEL